MSLFKKYLLLRAEIDIAVENLSNYHEDHMVCKAGCDSCCFSFKVFPVEFYAIKHVTGLLGDFYADEDIIGNERCLYLKDHKCTIYDQRPIICRTHGLPLLNMNEEGTDWVLSACELNFTEAPENYFKEENVFMQDTFNSKLFQINKEFLETHSDHNFSDKDLIPLKSLLNE